MISNASTALVEAQDELELAHADDGWLDATPAPAALPAPASGSSESNPDAQMLQLVSEVLRLAPIVSPGVLRSAAKQLQRALDTPSAAENEDSPVQPLRLPFTDERESDGNSDAASDASSRPPSTRADSVVSSDDDVPSGAAVFAEGEGPVFRAADYRYGMHSGSAIAVFDLGPDPGGFGAVIANATPGTAAARPGGGVPADGSDGGSAHSGSEDGGSEGKPRRRRKRGGRGRRGRAHDSLGVAHGRDMQCDVCDEQIVAPQWACHAEDMLQQSKIQDIVAKHQKRQATAKGRASDPDRREARFAMYRGFVAWQWADPLGAENRVRLPGCVMRRIRKLFPNPVCIPGVCDYYVECEKKGHYCGFRTADESRAVREGQFVGDDLR